MVTRAPGGQTALWREVHIAQHTCKVYGSNRDKIDRSDKEAVTVQIIFPAQCFVLPPYSDGSKQEQTA